MHQIYKLLNIVSYCQVSIVLTYLYIYILYYIYFLFNSVIIMAGFTLNDDKANQPQYFIKLDNKPICKDVIFL